MRVAVVEVGDVVDWRSPQMPTDAASTMGCFSERRSETPNGLEMSRPASRRLVSHKSIPLGWPGRLHRVVRRRRMSSRGRMSVVHL